MNARFLKKKVSRKFIKFYQKRRPKTGICGIYLSQGGNVTSFLKEQGDYFLEHPTYSPDIAPVTFSLASSQK